MLAALGIIFAGLGVILSLVSFIVWLIRDMRRGNAKLLKGITGILKAIEEGQRRGFETLEEGQRRGFETLASIQLEAIKILAKIEENTRK